MLLGDDGRIKVADFGLSGEFENEDDEMPNPYGTPAFVAPECLAEEKSANSGRAMDIWSLGVSLYAFIFGDVPFKAEFMEELFECIKSQPLVLPKPRAAMSLDGGGASPSTTAGIQVSDDLRDLLHRCVTRCRACCRTLSSVTKNVIIYLLNTGCCARIRRNASRCQS